ncbi:Phosphoadenosine phosphosulfate reductase thioredoxin [Conidiobolus coronatus NRRL 28638]|uniref:Phosphoadenosine phosphosulfate reductase thioredoxin n=1 Tax=Conidiobolus coronatus (strain ATCC 28846 / CBS 209.66 / NRRL 28638) TaxID=796925 RepID=A0A137P1E7_CONC2|nr:Phosphoadenosine phosphosulfate reductase thioredoxin [Conidiobolus coronatus NRRL 28638]|eukprot:KXN68778.1 Phosphoadenosine phosphosulfate reductase thioredoxin [Conidiobolus coronatus NRRL 28638]
MSSSIVPFTQSHIDHLNEKLSELHPTKVLEWAIVTFPNLYQTTAFGLSGLVITDMISKIHREKTSNNEAPHPVPLIFVDTLYHFDETLDLTKKVQTKYNTALHIYKPLDSDNTSTFEQLYGERLWQTNPDQYDYLVKVEPARRAYDELGVAAVISGRRRSQKGDRANIPIIEIESGTGLVKLNPLANWSFKDVKSYIDIYEVPYNALLDQGYLSVGDVHSTQPASDPNDERSGRWAGSAKTECGLHKDYFKMKAQFEASKVKVESS